MAGRETGEQVLPLLLPQVKHPSYLIGETGLFLILIQRYLHRVFLDRECKPSFGSILRSSRL